MATGRLGAGLGVVGTGVGVGRGQPAVGQVGLGAGPVGVGVAARVVGDAAGCADGMSFGNFGGSNLLLFRLRFMAAVAWTRYWRQIGAA